MAARARAAPAPGSRQAPPCCRPRCQPGCRPQTPARARRPPRSPGRDTASGRPWGCFEPVLRLRSGRALRRSPAARRAATAVTSARAGTPRCRGRWAGRAARVGPRVPAVPVSRPRVGTAKPSAVPVSAGDGESRRYRRPHAEGGSAGATLCKFRGVASFSLRSFILTIVTKTPGEALQAGGGCACANLIKNDTLNAKHCRNS